MSKFSASQSRLTKRIAKALVEFDLVPSERKATRALKAYFKSEGFLRKDILKIKRSFSNAKLSEKAKLKLAKELVANIEIEKSDIGARAKGKSILGAIVGELYSIIESLKAIDATYEIEIDEEEVEEDEEEENDDEEEVEEDDEEVENDDEEEVDEEEEEEKPKKKKKSKAKSKGKKKKKSK